MKTRETLTARERKLVELAVHEAAHATICAAGARWRHDRPPTQAELFAVLAANRDGDDAVLAAAGGTTAGVSVVPLVERCWRPIIDVARALIRDSVIRHGEVCAALGLSADDVQLAALQLAHIRSGRVPGSFRVTPCLR